MNIPQWIGDIFGIEKTAAALTEEKATFNVMDPVGTGTDKEKSRPVELRLQREDMDGDVVVLAYWSNTLKPLFKQSYDSEAEAEKAYMKIQSILQTIDERIKKGDYVAATDLSVKAIETLELENQKGGLAEAIDKEESFVVDGVGVYKCAAANPGFEFSDEFITALLKPGFVTSVLPADFMTNYPKETFANYSLPHISKDNYSAYLYDTFTINDKAAANVAVVEKNASGKSTYFVLGDCDTDRFYKICRTLTPIASDFNLIEEDGKIKRRAVSSLYKKAEDYSKLADEFIAKFKEDERDAAHMQGAIKSFADEKKVDGEKLQDAVNTAKSRPENKEPQKLNSMNLGVEAAKKKKENERQMAIETNIDTCGKDEWRLDQGSVRPTEEAIGFNTPLIVGFNNDAGTYDVKFMQGVRKNMNTDTVKTYLYNAGFTWKDVRDILEDAKTEDVVLYGETHKKAAEFIADINQIVKHARTEEAAARYVDSLSLKDKEKQDIKAMVSGVFKTAITEKAQEEVSKEIGKAIDADIPKDQAAAIAYSKAKAKGYDIPEKKSELDDAAKILKSNPAKVEVLAEFVDECYRDEVIKKDAHHAFYSNLETAMTLKSDSAWNGLAKAAEAIYLTSISAVDAIESKEEILKDVPKEDFERGVELEKTEHPDLPGEAITLEHLDEHEKYYDANVGLPAFEKTLSEMENASDVPVE